MKKPILVTGGAGFIGFHLCLRLAKDGYEVHTVDNVNDYYSTDLKRARLEQLTRAGVVHHDFDLAELPPLASLFQSLQFEHVVHLAAQAGVRYSLTNPHVYARSNLVAFLNVLDTCRLNPVKHLLYASSSSVYGANTMMPFSPSQPTNHPVSLYGATKKSNELMAHSYAAMFGTPVTGLRFFTVYGPWGRPDMALYKFADAILQERPLQLFNHGNMKRDFTYVDDVVEALVRLIDRPPHREPSWSSERPDPATSFAPYRVYNIGNSHPIELNRFLELIEARLGKKAHRELLPIQPGDVEATFSDTSALEAAIGFVPATSIEAGIQRSLDWYLSYLKVQV